MTPTVVRHLNRDDVTAIATVHRCAFPSSLTTRLGGSVVERYYRWQFDGSHTMDALGVVVDGVVVAFCLGGIFRDAVSGFVRANLLPLMAAGLMHPTAILQRSRLRTLRRAGPVIVRRLLVRDAGLRVAAHSPPGRSYSILALATHPAYGRRGYGALLMREMERRARERGFTAMRLTVATTNVAAIEFYEREGWSQLAETGEWTGMMTKRLGAR